MDLKMEGTLSSRQPLLMEQHQESQQKQPSSASATTAQHLPRSCERIAKGVAKLSTFRIPPSHLKRCSEGTLPFGADRLAFAPQQPKILINGIHKGTIEKNGQSRKSAQRHSSSSNCLLKVAQPMGNHSGRRMLSLDSSAPQMAGGRDDWLRTQQILVAEAEEAQRRRKQSCWNSVSASYAFLALSVLLSLSVVVGVCLFLHSFVPKEFYVNQQQQQQAVQQGQDEKSSRTTGSYTSQMNAETLHGNGAIISYKPFAEPARPMEFLLFYRRKRR